ncbi:MAG TPA: O-antigen ligase family protein [Xanthobacteraceae bacterium]|nr:O-antigen ligase family protein [Xanthobacteraceae bacterium]
MTLVASMLLGGGTRGGFLSDVILELIAIPALLLSLLNLFVRPWVQDKRPAEWALVICFATVVLPLSQLIPMPPWLWQSLPHRQDLIVVFDLLGRDPPWWPISVSPSATWLSVLSLLPPVAVFLCTLQLSYRERRSLTLAFLGVGVAAAMLGLIQVAQGPFSPLRFFAYTNVNEAVGFFANRNHFAALLYVLLLYGVAWATAAAFATGSLRDLRNLETSSIAALTASFLVLVVLIAVEAVTRSRAGMGLMVLGMFGAFALPLIDRRRLADVTVVKVMIAAMILAVLIAAQFALYRIFDRFAVDPLADARSIFTRNTLAAAWAYVPFGSGFGTFVPVYQTFEPARDTLADVYANHAHNDFAEVLLEGGIVALALFVTFGVWFVARFKAIWWRRRDDIQLIDTLLARAATIAIILVLAHSFVDYPLRTDAVMALFAVSCALLIEPLRRPEAGGGVEPALEELPRRTPPPSLPWRPPVCVSTPIAAAAHEQEALPAVPPVGGRWGENVEWPKQWSKTKNEERNGNES